MKKIYKWLIIIVVAILVGWQYDAALQKNLHEVEIRIKKFESVDLFNILEQISLAHIESVESVDILNKKQMEVQALEKEIKEKFVIQERELRAQVKTIETKFQKLRSELNDGLTEIERDVSTIDSVVDEKFKTLWMMINNK
jgi:ABC-type phosphate transport system auxiliary subunit